jgi:prepilin-type processing-associated H-X9-DG protein
MQNLNHIKRRRLAFTLNELLVVIGLIALLAAIIIPMISGGIDRARSTQSISNLRQIGAAVNLYVVANEGSFPYLNASSDRSGFNQIFWPLVLENEVLDHPRRTAHAIRKHPIFRDPLLSDRATHVISDYGGNSWIFLNAWGNQPSGEYNSQPFKRINVRDPARTVLVTTAINISNNNGSWWIPYDYPRGSNDNATPDPRLRGGYVGAVFVDGHVEAIPGNKLLNDLEFRRASFDPLYEK